MDKVNPAGITTKKTENEYESLLSGFVLCFFVVRLARGREGIDKVNPQKNTVQESIKASGAEDRIYCRHLSSIRHARYAKAH